MSDILLGRKEQKTETNNKKTYHRPSVKEVFSLLGKTPIRTSVWRVNKLGICFQQQKSFFICLPKSGGFFGAFFLNMLYLCCWT